MTQPQHWRSKVASWLRALTERIDVTSQVASLQRRTATIMFADFVGYSRMMHAAEDVTYRTLRDYLDEDVEPLIHRFQGRIVKKLGDGVLVEFDSTTNAIRCAQ